MLPAVFLNDIFKLPTVAGLLELNAPVAASIIIVSIPVVANNIKKDINIFLINVYGIQNIQLKHKNDSLRLI